MKQMVYVAPHPLLPLLHKGNSLTMAAIFCEKSLRENAANDFVLNLALSDITMGVGVMIPTAVAIARANWVFGDGKSIAIHIVFSLNCF